MKYEAGIDEAGRGPLAGPVIAAAVILNPSQMIRGLRDSKKLTEKTREQLFDKIISRCLDYGIGRAEPEEIDAINIFQATLLAMQRAFAKLKIRATYVWVDGLHCPLLPCPAKAVVGGDDLIPAISAASIVAKVTRDAEMREYDQLYPEYGFAKHKGYPTKEHRLAVKALGCCPIHRRSFKME